LRGRGGQIRTAFELGVHRNIKTGRGDYAIRLAAPIERVDDAVIVTVSLERADGIEKVALKFRIADGLIRSGEFEVDPVEKLAPWIEREFEVTREASLKTIRTERRLLEISFDTAARGPF
jgi:hypothetical protein